MHLKVTLFFFLIFFGLLTTNSYAQGENNNWSLSAQTLQFTPTGPFLTTSGGVLDTEEGSASISDANGMLLFYTDGSTIFNRNHQPMPNGQGLGLIYQYSATQGSLIVKDPGAVSRYYVFRLAAYGYPNGFAYSVVDMTLSGGLGGVVGSLNLLTPASQLTEKLTGVVHANGRDTWVIVHGRGDATFYAYLVSPTGIAAAPVTTTIGSVHTTHAGYSRASPNGEKLVQAVGTPGAVGLVELLDFDTQTGRPSNPVVLARPFSPYGVEFSGDGSKLYASAETSIYQYDLLAGSPAQVSASQTQVGQVTLRSPAQAGALQRGPDGKIYVAQNALFLGTIDFPNVRGVGCTYAMRTIALNAWISYGLPNSPNQVLNANSVLARIAKQGTCAGSAMQFTGSITQSVPGAVYRWEFGEPSSGSANTATGVTASHQFAAAGSYLITLDVLLPGGKSVVTNTTVTLAGSPTPQLGANGQALCPGDTRTLTAPAGTGYTYRWQDGSTGQTFRVTGPGTYTVAVTSAQGCTVTGSVTFVEAPKPVVTLGRDTSLCAVESIVLQPNPQPSNTTYRWQDGVTTPSYSVTQPGLYWVEVRTSSGCLSRDSITILPRPCVVTIPNIITPNGDAQNDYFVIKGLQAPEWELAIFNRWGQQVYQTASYDNRWDARGLARGIYYYYFTHKQTKQHHRGWVEVVF
jgi:gliding motility-associated-like protein